MNTYAVLTGAINNAGDFLIKKRVMELLKKARPDRKIMEFDRWIPLPENDLEKINNGKALILAGGPAIVKNFYPGIYPLTSDLSKIKVPIITMGVGAKNPLLYSSEKINFSKESIKLLHLISDSGYLSSVRDFSTLRFLQTQGFFNYLMTGCPALYSGQNTLIESEHISVKKIGFSLGVSFVNSVSMEIQMKEMILKIKDCFKNSQLNIAFHHSVQIQNEDRVNKTIINFKKKHLKFIDWLQEKSILYTDISGSADNMIEFYSSCDLHVGYRVHAHILMMSVSKPTVLIHEDQRGSSLSEYIGVGGYDGIRWIDDRLITKIFFKLGIKKDRIYPYDNVINQVLNYLSYILNIDTNINNQSQMIINNLFKSMQKFLNQLP